jgi:hypothetical protein
MRARNLGRFFYAVAMVAFSGALAAACGGNSGTNENGSLDGSVFDSSTGFSRPTSDASSSGGGNSNCVAKTCAELGFTCGMNADGCGNLVDCGSCSSPDYCGGGGYSKCGNPNLTADGSVATCTPKTCADYPAGTCGQQSDGCGSVTAVCATSDASLCPIGEFCGGGGTSLCGTGTSPDGGDAGDAGVCVPFQCTDYPAGTCGPQADGCGNLTANCLTCESPQFCGGGSTPNTCGGNNGMGADGGTVTQGCVAATCSTLPAGTCGLQGDGCGNTIGPCTTCVSPAFCGGGGTSLCGGDAGAGGGGTSSGGTSSGGTSSGGGNGGTCTAMTCADYPSNACGQQSDGCGGLTANCGTCTNPLYCGGGTTPGVCGGNDGHGPDGGIVSSCVPTTCAALGYNCGQAADGCGGIIGPCGNCQAPDVCGGAGQANVCGTTISCTGLCPQQYVCDGGGATLSGTVIAGTLPIYFATGQTQGDPVPNVLVYVPNETTYPYVTAFTPRSSESQAQQCSTCGADVSGNPLVETYTAYNGTFTLLNVPVGNNIPIVIQLGRWRRVFTVNTTCGSNSNWQAHAVLANGTTEAADAGTMPAGILRMPRTQAEGDIPLTALSTGSIDAMECVLLKMGVDQSEFTVASVTNPNGGGRIQMYQGNGASCSSGGTTPAETALMGTTSDGGTGTGTWNDFDQIILPCWGVDPTTTNSPSAKSAAAQANLVTYGNNGGHFFTTHYSYAWLYENGPYVNAANWDVNADTSINSMTGVVSPLVPTTSPGVFLEWLNAVNATSAYTANPLAGDVSIANARHDVDSVAGSSTAWITGTDPSPPRGKTSNMALHFTFDTPVNATSQCGHAIFSDFHVANSATGPAQTCTTNANCSSDVCNNAGGFCQHNNQCTSGSCNGNTNQCNGTCGTATFPSQANSQYYCGQTPMTAQEKILEYMIWDLASCVPAPPTNTCTKKTCANYPSNPCGEQSDGCGGLTADCNPCPTGQVCGGGGTPGVCGAPDSGACTALTCASYPGQCGQQSDGCGGLTTNCTCPGTETCGGGGVAGVCGTPSDGGNGCVPLTCASYPSTTCGVQADGCGGLTADCNPCTLPQTCGGAGQSSVCGTPPSTTCTPSACPANIECGPASNGCGGVIASCGTCTPPQTCGGGGTPGQCGGKSGCVPQTCAQAGVGCGPAGDGCGNLIQCGGCDGGTCGGGGTPGQCGGGTPCQPETCAQLGFNCGPAGDGCGGTIASCGTCTPPLTCGGAGQPGLCGQPSGVTAQ